MKNRKELWRTVKFFFFSVSAGVIELGTFAALNEGLHLPYWGSYLTALVLSVLWNFTLNRKFTFQSASNAPLAMAKVFGYYLVFTPCSTLAEHLLTSAGMNEYLVTILNMAVNLVTEYLFQRFVVYGKELDTKESGK